jgi:hypothetical protein
MSARILPMLAAAALLAFGPAASADKRAFPVYDNMFFVGKPDTSAAGLVGSNVIYGGKIWPHHEHYGVLPGRQAFAALVAEHSVEPGPIVLDIERLPLTGDRVTVLQRLGVFATLADWARAAAPGRVVGYFGYNTLTDVAPGARRYAIELARHVDAFFLPMYTRDDDRAAWVRRAKAEIREARRFAKGKPVYFYLWPQYLEHTPKAFQWIGGADWRFQLDTAFREADGIVIWGTRHYGWDASSGWWDATVAFMRQLPR